jgi:hypothetical protein
VSRSALPIDEKVKVNNHNTMASLNRLHTAMNKQHEITWKPPRISVEKSEKSKNSPIKAATQPMTALSDYDFNVEDHLVKTQTQKLVIEEEKSTICHESDLVLQKSPDRKSNFKSRHTKVASAVVKNPKPSRVMTAGGNNRSLLYKTWCDNTHECRVRHVPFSSSGQTFLRKSHNQSYRPTSEPLTEALLASQMMEKTYFTSLREHLPLEA